MEAVIMSSPRQVNCLQITPDKLFIAAGGNPHIRLFEVAGNANPNPVSNPLMITSLYVCETHPFQIHTPDCTSLALVTIVTMADAELRRTHEQRHGPGIPEGRQVDVLR